MNRKQCIIIATIESCVSLVAMSIVMSLIYLQLQNEFQQHQVEFQQHQVEFQQLQVEFQQLQHRITFLEKCNKPTAISDGSFAPDQTTYEHNQTIQFRCTDTTTHTATGRSTSTCINENFDPVIDFKCISKCNKPTAISDGSFTPDQTTYQHNQTIQFRCTDTTTHTATGSSTSTCINGNFDPIIDFKCILKCKPTAIADGSFTPDQATYEHNQTIQFRCTDTTTHTATGSSTSTCINGDFVPVIDFKCMKCGLISDIADEQITANSVWADHPNCGPQHGRLFSTSGYGGWMAYTKKGAWIQVDFGTDVDVTGIRTQGGGFGEWVTSYLVSFQRGTDKSFSYIEDNSGKTVIFDGNTDGDTVVAHKLDGPLSARYIRIHPVTYYGYTVMRFDVLTC